MGLVTVFYSVEFQIYVPDHAGHFAWHTMHRDWFGKTYEIDGVPAQARHMLLNVRLSSLVLATAVTGPSSSLP